MVGRARMMKGLVARLVRAGICSGRLGSGHWLTGLVTLVAERP